MAEQPKISVALATLNGEAFLLSQLQTLAAQTLLPCEVVVVDDGSTDQTLPIIREFAKTAPFPVRIHQNDQRLGYRRNFMRAASLCEGELISFCDQDDLWADNKFATIVTEFADPEVLMVYHNARLIDADGRTTGHLFKASVKDETLDYEDVEPWRVVPGFAQTIRRSLLEHSALQSRSIDMFEFEQEMPHDQWFLFLAAVLGKVRYVSAPLASYRLHNNNTSGWLPAKPINFVVHCMTHASFYVRTSHNALLNRMYLLQRIKAALPESQAAHIENVMDHYRHLIRYIRRRLDLYSAKSARVRVKILIDMIRNRTYSDPRAKIGIGNLIIDTCVGVPIGHTLR